MTQAEAKMNCERDLSRSCLLENQGFMEALRSRKGFTEALYDQVLDLKLSECLAVRVDTIFGERDSSAAE